MDFSFYEKSILRDKLAKSELEKNVLLDNMVEHVFCFDPEMRILWANKSAIDFVGIAEEEMKGRYCFEVLRREMRDCWSCPVKKILKTGELREEKYMFFRDSTVLLVKACLLRNAYDKIIGVLRVSLDITKRKQAEELLAAEKELLAVSFDSIGDGIITTDTEGKVLLLNNVAREITGWGEEEAAGKPFEKIFRIIDEKNHYPIKDFLAKKMAQREKKTPAGNSAEYDLLMSREGSRKIISNTVTPIRDRQSNILGCVIVFRDVTEEKKIESQFSLSQKLESIGQLAAGIAHEINTPMQYIGDNTRFVQESFASVCAGLDDYSNLLAALEEEDVTPTILNEIKKRKKELDIEYLKEEIPLALEQSIEGIERVSKLVLSMKDFAHPGKKEKKFTDINKGIEGTVLISSNEWKYVAVLETDLESRLPPVYCHSDEINQVVLNIILNAAQALREAVEKDSLIRGQIKIKTQSKKDYVEIIISDNGPGIPQEIIDKIYDPFFTTKEVGTGTGQGLTIAHNIIVNKHGGNISVESEVGIGTTFTISLPIYKS